MEQGNSFGNYRVLLGGPEGGGCLWPCLHEYVLACDTDIASEVEQHVTEIMSKPLESKLHSQVLTPHMLIKTLGKLLNILKFQFPRL